MFDIGFLELMVVGVVALLVIGPNRLPEVARTAGVYIGRFRRFVNSVQQDINREVSKHEELTRLLEEQKKIVSEHEILEELNRPVLPDENRLEDNRILKPELPAASKDELKASESGSDGR